MTTKWSHGCKGRIPEFPEFGIKAKYREVLQKVARARCANGEVSYARF